jgi:putative salt-induced outer membrane protein YdiY
MKEIGEDPGAPGTGGIMIRFAPLLLAVLIVLTPAAVRASTVGSHRVHLRTGDVLIGPIVEKDEHQIVLDHPVMGRVAIPMEQVQTMEDMGGGEPPAAAHEPESVQAATPESAPQPTPPAEAPAPAAAVPTEAEEPEKSWFRKFLDEWQIQLSFGFNMREHNHEYFDLNAGIMARHESPRDRWKIDAKFFYALFNDVETRREVHVGIQKDWLFKDSPWFLFGQGEYGHDSYKSWEHRMLAHGGLGFDLKPVLGIDAKLRGGFGMKREFGGVDPKTDPEGLAGGEMNWQISPRHSVAGTVQWYPSLTDVEDYRIRATGDYTFKVTQELSLRVGVWDEYDSTVPEGFDTNDLRVFGSMVLDF